jgi:quercetin dioxygenase-like cupin family protein
VLHIPDPRILTPQATFTDARGRIISLPEFRSAGALVIESRAGAVRGNHLHQHESHLQHMLSGTMIYLERSADGALYSARVGPGQGVVSERGVAHCSVFTEDSVFVVLSDTDRTGDKYENEIVRVEPLHADLDLAGYGLDQAALLTR